MKALFMPSVSVCQKVLTVHSKNNKVPKGPVVTFQFLLQKCWDYPCTGRRTLIWF
jgi:hypothetical protein